MRKVDEEEIDFISYESPEAREFACMRFDDLERMN